MKKDIVFDRSHNLYSRRHFIGELSLGAFGFVSSTLGVSGHAAAEIASPHGISRVSFVTGQDRREMVYQTLKPFENEIKKGISGKQVVIKPNFVRNNVPLCATHPDAVRGLLDFLKPLYHETIIIGESTYSPTGTMLGYKNYNYLPLTREYNVKLIDLNEQPATTQWILGNNRKPLGVNIINTYLDPKNYIFSITRLKTHNSVVATLALKNMVMGSPINHYDEKIGGNEKRKMHEGGTLGINYNLFLIAHLVRPHFSILDGLVGMEGNGPSSGTAIEHGVALASDDVIAIDRVGVELMNINYEDIGYLQWCARAGIGQDDLTKIKIIGHDIEPYRLSYKLHENIEKQLEWKKDL